MHPIHRILSVQHVADYQISLRFDDGTERVVDLEPILEGEFFGALREPAEFAAVTLDEETKTVVWPNGADLDPSMLHGWPDFADEVAARARSWRLART